MGEQSVPMQVRPPSGQARATDLSPKVRVALRNRNDISTTRKPRLHRWPFSRVGWFGNSHAGRHFDAEPLVMSVGAWMRKKTRIGVAVLFLLNFGAFDASAQTSTQDL